MDEPVCPSCRGALQRIAELEAPVEEVTRKPEEAMGAGKRRAARCEAVPKDIDVHSTHGYRAPGSVTECHRAPPPSACPHGRGLPVGTGPAEEFSTGLPSEVHQFVLPLGRGTGGAPAHGRRPLLTTHALGSTRQSSTPVRADRRLQDSPPRPVC
jgi:hypothetical protein